MDSDVADEVARLLELATAEAADIVPEEGGWHSSSSYLLASYSLLKVSLTSHYFLLEPSIHISSRPVSPISSGFPELAPDPEQLEFF